MRIPWTRLTAGTAAAVLGAVVVTSGAVPTADVPSRPPVEGTILPEPQPLACPGQVRIPVGDIDSGDPDLGSGSDEVEFVRVAERLTEVGSGFESESDVAAQVERIGSGDVAGLAAAPCLAPRRDSWLVGGSTALGASARLVLTNPTDAATEATVSVFAPWGPLEQRTVVSVGAHGQQELLLEGAVPEVPGLVVRVQASGAGVVAALQDSRLDGFQPAGTDWVVAGAPPSRTLVVPGASAGGTAAGAEVILRLLAPEGAVASLTLAGPQGDPGWAGVSDLVLDPGAVTEVAVPSREAAAVEVAADAPVVAAVLTRIPRAVEDGPRGALAWDLAWSAAQHVEDGQPRTVAATPHVTAVAVQASTGGDFELRADDGTVVAAVTLPDHGAATVPVTVPAGRVLTGTPGFAWELVLEDRPGFLSRLAPRRTDLEPVTVAVDRSAYLERP